MKPKNKESQASLAQEVYLKLKDQIISLNFIPGENLLEENLRVEFKVSRTPVRMALCKLEQEGLVSHRPGYGYSVRDIRLHHVPSLFQIRKFLEVPSAQLACQNATEEELKDFQLFVNELDEAIKRREFEQSIKMGVEFHYRIAVMSKNEILCDLVQGLNEKISMLARIILQSENHMEQSQIEHRAITESIIKRDVEKARELAKQHISQSSKRFMQLLQTKTDLLSITPNLRMSRKER
jgi:DNA-binding GntR family transcriptional regulator